MRVLLATLAASVMCAAAPSWAGYSKGGAFRTPGYGARAWGMGGAATVTVDDEGAVSWNPAMLSQLRGSAAGASYVNLVAGATARQSQVAYARVLQGSEAGESGAVVARHAVGAMYTNLHLGLSGGDGYDENLLRLAYAYSPDYFVTFAIAGDFFVSTSDVSGFDAGGSSVDFAVRFMLTARVNVGVVARNAFSRYSYEDGVDFSRERAFVFAAGSDAIPYARVEGDVVFEHGDVGRVIGGFETDYLFDVLCLRAGAATIASGETRGVPYFGFGLRGGERLRIDYNANIDDDKAFEDTHRFSLSVAIR
jgi:hypothetical protein